MRPTKPNKRRAVPGQKCGLPNRVGYFFLRSVLRLREADRPLIAKDKLAVVWQISEIGCPKEEF